MGALPDMFGERWVNPLPDEASRAKWETFRLCNRDNNNNNNNKFVLMRNLHVALHKPL